MSDNPLADWLRERHAALGDATATDSVEGEPPQGAADWAGSEGSPVAPGAARWEGPPDDEGEARVPRRRRLLLLAVVPWAVAAGLGLVALVDTDTPAAVSDTPHTAGDAPSPAPAAPADPLDAELGAAAAVAVRLSVTTSGDLPDGDEQRYVDLAIPDSVRWIGDVAVVTVSATVLEGSAERWTSTRPARFAVPTRWVDGRPVVLDEPWALPLPPPVSPSGEWEPVVADPDAIARAAAAAGYAETEVIEAATHPDHPTLLRARIRARGPDEAQPRTHQVWFHAGPEPAVVGLGQPGHQDRRRP